MDRSDSSMARFIEDHWSNIYVAENARGNGVYAYLPYMNLFTPLILLGLGLLAGTAVLMKL